MRIFTNFNGVTPRYQWVSFRVTRMCYSALPVVENNKIKKGNTALPVLLKRRSEFYCVTQGWISRHKGMGIGVYGHLQIHCVFALQSWSKSGSRCTYLDRIVWWISLSWGCLVCGRDKVRWRVGLSCGTKRSFHKSPRFASEEAHSEV